MKRKNNQPTNQHTHTDQEDKMQEAEQKNSTETWNSSIISGNRKTQEKMQFKSEKNGLRRMLYRY